MNTTRGIIRRRAGDVGEPLERPDPEHVESPHEEDRGDRDHVRQSELDGADAEVRLRVGEPAVGDDVADHLAEDREHHRPADPVAERRHRSDERRVPAPALVGIERDAAGPTREHRGRLGVDPGLQQRDHRRDAPQDDRAHDPEVAERVPELAEEEARVRQADREPVPPSQRLQQLAFLNDRCSHTLHPSR